jgi:hypothetical protein
MKMGYIRCIAHLPQLEAIATQTGTSLLKIQKIFDVHWVFSPIRGGLDIAMQLSSTSLVVREKRRALLKSAANIVF